jgi:thymidylate synthase
MALHIKAPTIAIGWSRLLSSLVRDGKDVYPRGKHTREIMNVCLEITDGLYNIFVSAPRNLNYKFMIAEWLWITMGSDNLHLLSNYNKFMNSFSDDGQILSGAYGPRLSTQWTYILDTLKNDTDSRQGVAIIWRENPKPSKDIPCTISIQWMIRDKKLHCIVNMRSSDVWLGIPYDYFTFSQLTNIVASRLKIEVGSVTMNLASSHIYEENVPKAIECMSSEIDSINSPRIPQIQLPTTYELNWMLSKGDSGDLQFPSVFSSPIWNAYANILVQPRQKVIEVIHELRKLKT